jgi:hypothetical protein
LTFSLPLVERHRRQRRVLLHPRIGDQDIDGSERLQRLREQAGDLGLVRDIGADGDRAATGGLDAARQFFRGLRLRVVVDDDSGPGCGQLLGAGITKAGTGPGHNGGLSVDAAVHGGVPR